MKTTTSSAGAFKVVKKMKTQAVQKKTRAADLTLLVEHSTGHIDDGGGESEEDDDEEDEENLSQVIWNKPLILSLISAYSKLKKQTGSEKGLKNKGWKTICSIMQENYPSYGSILTPTKCRNKFQRLQKDYAAQKKINDASGLGTDTADQVWAELIASNPHVAKFRGEGKEFPYFNEMATVIGDQIFTGDFMVSMKSIAEGVQSPEANKKTPVDGNKNRGVKGSIRDVLVDKISSIDNLIRDSLSDSPGDKEEKSMQVAMDFFFTNVMFAEINTSADHIFEFTNLCADPRQVNIFLMLPESAKKLWLFRKLSIATPSV